MGAPDGFGILLKGGGGGSQADPAQTVNTLLCCSRSEVSSWDAAAAQEPRGGVRAPPRLQQIVFTKPAVLEDFPPVCLSSVACAQCELAPVL